MIRSVKTEKAPQAIGPYSQAVEANGFIFCSGQLGLDPQTGQLVEGVENQTRQALINLQEVLKAAGADLNCVLKTTIYLKSISDFNLVNSAYAEFFSNHKPARATVAVSDLPKGALIEIDAIALKK